MNTNDKYKTIVIDPPWPIAVSGHARGHKLPYQTMDMVEIAALPIRSLTDSDCNVFLWTTNSMMPQAFSLLKHWGLRYKTTITWVKGYGMGRPPYTATEHCLMASIGQPPRPHQQGGRELYNWIECDDDCIKPKHSVKPDGFYRLIEKISQGKYLDMFSRRIRIGWSAYGNEAPKETKIVIPFNNNNMNTNEYNKPEDFKGETINVDAESTIINEDHDDDAETIANIAKSYSAIRQKEKQHHSTDSISYRITVASNRLKDLEKAKDDINKAISDQRKKLKSLHRLSEQLNALGK